MGTSTATPPRARSASRSPLEGGRLDYQHGSLGPEPCEWHVGGEKGSAQSNGTPTAIRDAWEEMAADIDSIIHTRISAQGPWRLMRFHDYWYSERVIGPGGVGGFIVLLDSCLLGLAG